MKKALDILFEQTNGDADYVSVDCCLQAMKAYAKQVAEKVRKDCADNAGFEFKSWITKEHSINTFKESILSTPITLD